MRIVWPWQRKRVERDLDSMESLLATAFKPVSARPAFVNGLRKRLVGSRNPLARAGLSTLELILLIGGAIVGVVVLIFTIIRRFGGLFGRLAPSSREPKAPKRAAKKRAA